MISSSTNLRVQLRVFAVLSLSHLCKVQTLTMEAQYQRRRPHHPSQDSEGLLWMITLLSQSSYLDRTLPLSPPTLRRSLSHRLSSLKSPPLTCSCCQLSHKRELH